MTFQIFVKTGEFYCDDGFGDREWDGDDGYYEDYEPSWEELTDALVDVTIDTYFYKLNKVMCGKEREELARSIRSFILDSNLMDDDEYMEGWRDALTEYFADRVGDDY